MSIRCSELEFRWIDWNIDHIGKHGISPKEAETVIRNAKRPYPLANDDDKYLVWGRGNGGRLIQAVFVLDPADDDDGTDLEYDVAFVIHARPLTAREKKKLPKGI